MNKSYKSIWNESLGAWVATSEVTAARGKKASSRKALAAAASVAVLLVAGGVAQAQQGDGTVIDSASNGSFPVNSAVATAEDDIAIGNGAFAGGQSSSPAAAIGYNATANAENALAVGSGAEATNHATTAVGSGAKAQGSDSMALGESAVAVGASSVAAGFGAQAYGSDSVAMGAGTGTGGTATNSANTAVGAAAGQTVAGSNNAAFGLAAGQSVTGSGNAAVGNAAGRFVTGSDNVALGTSAGSGASIAAPLSASNTISVGNAAKASAADALAIGRRASGGGIQAIAIGLNSTAKSDGGIAIGSGASIDGDNAIALGTRTLSYNGIAIGYNGTYANSGSVAIGDSATAANQGVAIGLRAKAEALDDVFIGRDSGAGGSAGGGNVGVGSNAGSGSSGQANSALGASAGAGVVGNGNVAVGFNAGALAKASRSISIGWQSNYGSGSNVGNDSIAIGSQTISSGISAIAMGTGARAKGAQSISIGTGNVVNGNNSGAIGDPSIIDAANSYSVGNTNAIAAGADNTFVFGNNVKIGAGISEAVALGNASSVTQVGGVALGANSVAGTTAGVAGYDPKTGSASTNTTATWRSTMAAVSVGNGTTATRQITGVAAGFAATDAVNVAQLTAAQTHYYSINSTDTTAGSNFANDGATAANALAAGADAKAAGLASTAVGFTNTIDAASPNSTAVGSNNTLTTSPTTGAIGFNNSVAGAAGLTSVVGQNNTLTSSLVATVGTQVLGSGNTLNSNTYTNVVGTGNTVTRDDYVSLLGSGNTLGNTTSSLSYTSVIGSGNTVYDGSYLRVLGSGNALTGGNNYTSVIGSGNSVLGVTEASVVGGGNTINAGATRANVLGTGTTIVANATNTISIGSANVVGGNDGIAIGNTAYAYSAQSTAVGSFSAVAAAAPTGVALGSNSLALTAKNGVGYVPSSATAAQSAAIAATTVGTLAPVSVGNTGQTRQIQNVAAGTLNSDAVNVAQLTAATGAAAVHYYSVNDGGVTTKGNYDNDGATGTDSLAAGVGAKAAGIAAVAVGKDAAATSTDEAAVAIGQGAIANGNSSGVGGATAVGAGAQATGNGSIALGSSAAYATRATGSYSTAIGINAQATADRSVALGVGAQAKSVATVAIGDGAGANYTSGARDVYIGSSAGYQNTPIANPYGDYASSVMIGTQAGANAQPGVYNAFLGYAAGRNSKNGVEITNFGGVQAGQNIGLGAGAFVGGQGNFNTAVGQSGQALVGSNNTYVAGLYAGNFSKGNDNIGVGAMAGISATGSRNIALGSNQGDTSLVHLAVSDYPTRATGGAVVGDDNIALGTAAGTGITASNTIALGTGALAGKDNAIAIGSGAQATGAQSISIGKGNVVSGNNSGAIGDPSFIDAANSYSVGNKNTIGTGADNTFVLGNNVKIAAGISDAVALGDSSSVTQVGGVALGADSKASTAAGVAGFDPKTGMASTDTSATWKSTMAAVSVGDGTTATRQITGVAAGSAATDAVNVAQLAASQTHYYSVNDGGTQGANYNNDGATGLNSLAAGVGASATQENTVAIGNGAKVISIESIAVGRGATAAGQGEVTLGTASGVGGSTGNFANVNIGYVAGNNVRGAGITSIGYAAGSDSSGRDSAFIGSNAGQRSSGNSNYALGSGAGQDTSGSGNLALGTNAGPGGGATTNDSISIGTFSTPYPGTDRATAIGYGATAMATDSLALGGFTVASNPGDVALGGGARTAAPTKAYAPNGSTTVQGQAPTSVVSVGSGVAGGERQITNVAAGGAPTDAVNVSQLKAAQTHYYSVNDGGVTTGNYSNDGALGANSIASGVNASTTATARQAIAIGDGASGVGVGSTAIGVQAGQGSTKNDYGLAVGYQAGQNVTGESNVTVGGAQSGSGVTGNFNSAFGAQAGQAVQGDYNTHAGATSGVGTVGSNNTGIGAYAGQATQGNNNTAVGMLAGGLTQGDGNVAIGKAAGLNATIDAGVIANDSISIGSGAYGNATNAIAIGTSASASVPGGVALGSNSAASTVAGVAGYDPRTLAPVPPENVNPTWRSTAAAVSVGDAANGVTRQITGVAAGGAPTDAVNVAQLEVVSTQANKPLTFTGNSGTVDRKLGETLAITGTGSTVGTYSGANVKTAVVDNEVQIQMTDAPVFTSVTTGNTRIDTTGLTITGGPSVTAAGINANNTKITNLTDGSAPKDAVNFSQLETFSTQANKPLTFAGNSGTVDRKLGETLTITGDASTAGSYSGANVKTVIDPTTGAVKLQLADNPEFASVKTGDTTLSTTGVQIGSNVNLGSTGLVINGGPSMTTAGVDAGGKQITNVAPGAINATSTDAVNGSQLSAVSTTASKGWNITAQGANGTNVTPGAAVDLKNTDGNVVVSKTGANNDVAFDLSPNLTATSVTTGATRIDTTGLTITGGPSVTTAGVDAGGKKITNVAAGTANTDAVNVSQLNTVSTQANKPLTFAGNSGTVDRKLGETLTITGDASTAGSYSGANVKTVVDPTTGAVKLQLADNPEFTSVKTGDTTLSTTGVQVGSNVNLGSTGLVINGGPSVTMTGIDAGSQKITNVAPGAINATSTDAVNGSQLSAVSTTTSKGWNLTAQGVNGTNVAPGAAVDLKSTDGNVLVSKTGANNDVAFDLSPNLTATSVTTGATRIDTTGLTITGGPSVTTAGVDAGGKKITNVAAGTANTDAVNVSQLNTVSTQANKPLTFAGNSGTVDRKLGETLTITGDASTAGSYSGANVKTVVDQTSGAVKLQLADNPEFASVKTGDTTLSTTGVQVGANVNLGATGLVINGGPSVTTAGIDAGGKQITNVAPGAINATSTDAVNGSQLSAVSTTANKGWNLTAQGANGTNVAPGAAVDLKNTDGNVVVSKTGTNNDVTFDLSPNLTATSVTTGATRIDTTGLTITGGPSVTTAGIDAGGKQITNVAPGAINATSTDAVNGSQLSAVSTTANKGWNLTAQGANGTNVAPGAAVDLKNTDGNVVVSKTGTNNDVTFDLSPNLTATSVTTGATRIDTTGLTITGGPSVTTAGIDAGGKQITNVAPGAINATSTDAVNGSQLSAVSTTANKGWNLTAQGANGTNVAPGAAVDLKNTDGNVVVSKTGANNDVTFDLSPNLTGTSLTTGATRIDTTGLTITGGPSVTTAGIDAGSKQITNVAAGTANSDAVNVSQLNTVSTQANKPLTFATNSGTVDKKLGETLGITGDASTAGSYSGANVKTVIDPTTGAVKLQLADNPEFTSVKTGETTVSTTGVQVGSNVNLGSTGLIISGGPSVTTTGIDAGGKQITNVAPGAINATSTDAVNGSQLSAVSTTANKGWNLTAQGANGTNVAPGAAVDLKNTDGNVVVSKTGANNDVTFDLSPNLTGTSLTTGATRIDTTGLTITGGPSVTTAGIDAGGKKITNVAPGVLNANSTDAVNGAQLYATNTVVQQLGNTVTNINTGGGIKYFHANSTLADSAATGANSVAVGPKASASAADAIAIGNAAASSKANSVALGAGSTTSVGAQTAYTGAYMAAGSSSSAGEVSVGSAGALRTVTNVADGVGATDAVNVRQLNAGVSYAVDQSKAYTDQRVTNVSSGAAGMFQVSQNVPMTAPSPTGTNSVAGGSGAVASGTNSVAIGNTSQALANNSIAIGQGAKSNAGNSVALGTASVADRANTVSVGAAGAERQVVNVAAGSAGTDAVNVNQLKGVQAGAVNYATNADGTVNYNQVNLGNGQASNGTVVSNVAPGVAGTDAVNVNQLNAGVTSANQYTDAKVGQLQSNIDRTAKDASAGTAGAMAMANLPQAYIPGKSMLAVGVASYDGASAIALGVSKLSDNGQWIVKFSASGNSRSKFGVGAGAGFSW